MFDGVFLGLISFLTFSLTFRELPQWAQRFLMKRRILTDLGCGALTWLALTSVSKSVTAVVASMVCGLSVNLAQLWYAKKVGWKV
jgi:hypothetical protein